MGDNDRRPMTKEPLIDGDPGFCALHLTTVRLTSNLPGELAYLSDGLCGDGLAETSEPATWVHGEFTSEGCYTIA